MVNWYYGVDGGQNGPVGDDEMRAMLASGLIDRTTLVWREEMESWQPLGQVPEWTGEIIAATGTAVPGYTPPVHGPPVYGPNGYMPHSVPTNGLAIASLVCGVMSLLLMFSCMMGILAAVPAVICGHLALGQIKRAGLPVGGKGMAIAGLITGYLSILATLIVVVVVVFSMVIASDMF